MDGVPVNDYQYEQLATPSHVIVSTNTNHADIIQINALFEQGKVLMAQKNYTQAIIAFDKGIALMGDHYLSSQLIDDTGMKLMLGNAEQEQGHLERAAHLKHNVLESRIQVYKKRYPQPKDKTEGKDL